MPKTKANLQNETCLGYNGTKRWGGGIFSVVGRFHLIHKPEVLILGDPVSEDCKSFPVNTLLRYTQVPFKKGLTVILKIRIWLFLYK